MNLLATTTVLLLAFLGHAHAASVPSDCPFSQIYSALKQNSCLVVTGEGPDSDVHLGYDCTAICPPDDYGLMRLEGTELCLQASHGEHVKDGSKLRAYPCDEYNEFQHFAWIDDATPHTLKLLYTEYCAVSLGVNAVDGDPIIMKPCDHDVVQPLARLFWWGD